MNKQWGMKGLLLTSVSAIAIGFASAALAAGGGAVYLSQTGSGQTAQIDQSGGTGDKVGSLGTPFLQENGTGSGHNGIVINQNSGTVSELANIGDFVHAGSGNKVTGFQSGTNNNAEIDQEGNNSIVKLQQTGANNGPTGPGSGDPWWNGSYGNLILQDWTANGSTVDLTQTTNKNATNGNVFNIGQGGGNNKITATQTGYNKLWIRQGTKAPDLWGWTFGDFFDPTYTPHSLAALSDSTIKVDQSVGGTDPSERNYAALGQGYGSGNKITVGQTGGSNSVDANQVGSGNIFKSTQISSNPNTNWNFIGGEAGWPGGPNWLTGVTNDFRPILQVGTGNEYDAYQSGMNLWAFGSQTGAYNLLSSTQTGDGNQLYTIQNGDSNQIFANQFGSGNLAYVSQNHNNSTAIFTQSGAGNMATITQ